MPFSLFVSLILSCLVSYIASNNDTCGFSSQCIYNIQVKHCSGQKSQVRNVRSALSCNCALVSQVATAASGVRNWTDNVVREFNEVAESLRGSKYQLQQKHGELLSISKQNQVRNATLQSHSNSLVNTNNAIVKERQNWAAEKSRLQKELMNVHREIQICKSSLTSNSSTNSTASVTSTLTFCNFESSTLCGYHQDKDEDLDWSRGSNTLHSSTGPKQDHTYGNPQGHYMYIDAYGQASHSSSSKTKIARLTSPTFPPAKGYCILFWYNLHGSDIQDLKVYAKIGGCLGNPVFQHTGQIDENWHLGKIDLDSEYTASSFQIVFEGSTKAYIYYYYNSHFGRQHDNRYEYGNIAIDDVYAYNTSCHNVPRYPKNTHVYTNGSSTTRYTFNTTPTSWFDAQNACKNEGPTSHLISINSQEEQAFIVKTIKRVENTRVAGMNGFYTSGSDERSENTFEWTDTGTPYALSYKNWHSGQPNNVAGAQNCLLLQYPEEFEWGDVSCDEKHPFICEINDSF